MKRSLVLVALGLGLLAAPAAAQVEAIGPRLGVSIDPDQFVFGGHLVLGPYDPDIYLSPNVEIGVGDDLTVIQFNFDVDYRFPGTGPRWSPYIGAGPAVAVIDFDDERFPGRDDSSTEFGINFLGGAIFKNASGNAFLVELRIGVGDIPELKALVGWNFPT